MRPGTMSGFATRSTSPPTSMEILPIDLESLVAVILGISIVLVPVIGLTARFALKPTVEALARMFEVRGLDDTVHILERRMDLQEQQIAALETSVRRLTDTLDFDRQLRAGETAQAKIASPSDPTS